jgi:hypothetical protein
VISYEPAPTPTSSASPPTSLFHFWASKYQTAFENKPTPTRYRREVDMTKKYWSVADAPPLTDVSSHQTGVSSIDSLVDNIADKYYQQGSL